MAFPDVPGPVAEPPALGLERLHLDFAVAHQGIKNPVAQAHPFPDRSVGKALGDLDFVADGAGEVGEGACVEFVVFSKFPGAGGIIGAFQGIDEVEKRIVGDDVLAFCFQYRPFIGVLGMGFELCLP